jgi:hypothetical protein
MVTAAGDRIEGPLHFGGAFVPPPLLAGARPGTRRLSSGVSLLNTSGPGRTSRRRQAAE